MRNWDTTLYQKAPMRTGKVLVSIERNAGLDFARSVSENNNFLEIYSLTRNLFVNPVFCITVPLTEA